MMKSIPAILFALMMGSVAWGAEQSPPDDAAIKHNKEVRPESATQTIQQGGQTEVKVTNRAGTYIVKPNQNVGTSLPGDTQSSSNHAAQWVVESWGGKKATESAEPPSALPPNPKGSDNSKIQDIPTNITK